MFYSQCSRIAGPFSLLAVKCRQSKKCVLARFHTNGTKKTFDDWAGEWFQGVDIPCPAFFMSGCSIKVLTHPIEFYNELLKRSSSAGNRITLASLYLGNGDKEEKLVDAIYDNLKSSQNPINVNVLLECTRGSRGTKNSRTLLLPIIREFRENSHVALFHSPNLRGIWKAIVPERFDETINVSHLKVYLFDNTLIMSGANLSDDYFTNRQDRYIIFENCKELCDYFEDLVKTISKFSFSLQSDDTLALHPSFLHHPYHGVKESFNTDASKVLMDFTKRYKSYDFSKESVLSIVDNGETTSEKSDTLVFPLLQMRYLGINQDELVTRNIIQSAPEETNLLIATAYFNLTDDYWNAILTNKTEIDLIMAHPKAMGFYQVKGLAGGIPNAYGLIAKRRFRDLVKLNQLDRVKFLEYHREGWTFHGKGLWAHLDYKAQNSADTSAVRGPLFSLIGSPNFGKRSVYRDMEAQVGIITENKELQRQLIDERDNLKAFSTQMSSQIFKEEERHVSWWVYLIGTFRNDFF